MNLFVIIFFNIILFHENTSQRTHGGFTEKDWQFWYRDGLEELNKAINLKHNTNIAKNIILFVGDGMSANTLTAARILKGQLKNKHGEEGSLVFEEFPHVGVVKTYNIDSQVADSAGTATAFLTGVKANIGTIGVSAAATRGLCSSTKSDGVHLDSIALWAIDEGKDAGFVTTSDVTGATPAPLYARSAEREWKCEDNIKDKECKDIGRQLIEDSPGNKLKVIMGGGRLTLRHFSDNNSSCTRESGRDLPLEWLNDKIRKGVSAQYVTTAEEMKNTNADYVMGIFADESLPCEWKRRKDISNEVPHIKDMTEKAINLLKKNDKGYFLLVEQSKIDNGHHDGNALVALQETLALEEAVQVALDLTTEEDTLIIVTADHAHVMTINGYPKRGHPITGSINNDTMDKLPYTTLMYTTGSGFNYTVRNNTAVRWNISETNTHTEEYKQLAAVPTRTETHGGDDVLVYAKGPMAHLFHGLHEQSYIAHVMSYASCVGPNKHMCQPLVPQESQSSNLKPPILLLLLACLFKDVLQLFLLK